MKLKISLCLAALMAVFLSPSLAQAQINNNPCASAPTQRININQTANTQLQAGLSGYKIYVCHVFIAPVATATNIAFVSGTGSTCATGVAAVIQGGSGTAATGANLAANGGWVQGNGGAVVDNLPSGANLCLLQSAANQISGVIQYVLAP